MDEQLKQEVIDLVKAAMLDVLAGRTSDVNDVINDKKEKIEQSEKVEQEEKVGEVMPKTNRTPSTNDIVQLRSGPPKPTPKRKKVDNPAKSPKHPKPSSSASRNVQARTLPFDRDAERPDLFVELGFDKMCKEDVEIDKKLNEGRQPTERGRRTTMVDVQCARCDRPYTVSTKLVTRDSEEGLKYICDKCIRGR